MQKIATMTFHWATNFGAVLQAYALQQYLISKGYQTEIINYQPIRAQIMRCLSWLKHGEIKEFCKEVNLKKFRKKNLVLSTKVYRSHNDLLKVTENYYAAITGSDQVWNQGFTLNGEGKTTLSYFLDFLGPVTKKIAYAVSFGTNQISKDYFNAVRIAIEQFDNISVRENTGIGIVKQFKKEVTLVCDPVLLLKKEAYLKLIEGKNYPSRTVFTYVLHRKQHLIHEVIKTVNKLNGENNEILRQSLDIYEWLYYLKNSTIVITNSYHGVILSLLFNTPLIVVPVEGSNMNDRINTIMRRVGLENRIIVENDFDTIQRLYNEPIDWVNVNLRLAELSESGKSFINCSFK